MCDIPQLQRKKQTISVSCMLTYRNRQKSGEILIKNSRNLNAKTLETMMWAFVASALAIAIRKIIFPVRKS